MNVKIISLVLFLGVSYSLPAQVTGLWEIYQVKVGDQEMTPQAKWTRFNADGNYQAGNGWQQNDLGSWHLNHQQSSLTLSGQLPDPFGPFQVNHLSSVEMILQRQEEGMQVVVYFKKIQKLPMAPWDRMQGIWLYEKVWQNEQDVTPRYNPEGQRFIFIRWDRVTMDKNGPAGIRYGTWQVNAHRPELTLFNQSENSCQEKWNFEINEPNMIWSRTTEAGENIRIRFVKTQNFPGS
ncbi:MAG: hypothetical protein ACNS62_14355 [Candidatus Cyclobacteriaceae bacterium M3_2C_046]